MLLNVSVNAQTSILPLTSDDLFKAYDNYQKGIYAKAYEIFKSLSDNGDVQATYGLGICYYNGKGTTTNLQEAFNCFDKSYHSGNKSAAFIIGKCYFYGQGVEKDLDEAETYLTEASNQGNMEAKALMQKIDTEKDAERKKRVADVVTVDLGLPSGTLWADRNIGATSPEDYGDYYAWGETTTKSNYDWSNYKHGNGSTYDVSKKYNKSDGRTTLERIDDVACQKWGNGWCMPTHAQFQELKDNCTWTWTSRNGKKGFEITGQNGKTIFLPAAGWRCCLEHIGVNAHGYYWSSSYTISSSSLIYAFGLNFLYGNFGNDVDADHNSYRSYGYSVRPVRCR